MTGPRSSVFTSVRRAPRRRWTSYAKLVAVLIVLVAAAALVTALVLWVYASRQLTGQPVVALAEAPPAPEASPLPEGRQGTPLETVDTLVAVVAGSGQARRSAFVGVVQTGPDRAPPVLLSLPAELVVDVAGEGPMRLGEIPLDDGDADQLVRTVQGYTGIDLDHYVVLEPDLVPALARAGGGVALCDSGRCQPLTAEQVADRALTVPSDATDAASWVERQRRLLAAAAVRAEQPRTWLNPLAVKGVVDAVADHTTSDVELGALRLAGLVALAAQPGPLDIRQVPGIVDPETGAVRARPEDAQTLFAAMQQAGPMPDQLGTSGPRQLEPQEVSVLVLNGVGTAGLASDVADVLAGSGFEVAATDNADDFDHARTLVAHGPDDDLAAKLVAQQFDDAELVELEEAPEHDGEPLDVVVTVGEDWSGA